MIIQTLIRSHRNQITIADQRLFCSLRIMLEIRLHGKIKQRYEWIQPIPLAHVLEIWDWNITPDNTLMS